MDNLDRIDVNNVISNLQIGRTIFYTVYLKDCQISPTRVGKQSYITGIEFQLLKSYHLARTSGKKALAEFLEKLPTSEDASLITRKSSIEQQIAQYTNFVVPTIYEKLSARLSLLEQYAASPHARLSTYELSQVLELSPRTLHGNSEYYRLGFLFRRDVSGGKQRQCWQVLIPVK